MKGSELRIGNLILWARGYVKVSAILESGLIRIEGNSSVFSVEGSEPCLLPLTITKEWLDMLDWKNRKDKDIAVSFGLTSGTIHFVAGNYYTECYSVHHLQNLYHALTGEELTINED